MKHMLEVMWTTGMLVSRSFHLVVLRQVIVGLNSGQGQVRQAGIDVILF